MRLAELGERQPARLEMLVAQHDVAAARQAADKGRMRTKRPGSTSNRCSSSALADLDGEPRLLLHLALQRGAMVLARIGPAARQIPFAALVQQQQHAVLMDQDAFDGDGSGHRAQHPSS